MGQIVEEHENDFIIVFSYTNVWYYKSMKINMSIFSFF
ncbi:hypothetical protein FH5_00263 [Priestia endophytica]|nr:hypothetical protein FH5_00263 [Priestia endophytica]